MLGWVLEMYTAPFFFFFFKKGTEIQKHIIPLTCRIIYINYIVLVSAAEFEISAVEMPASSLI